MNETLNIVTGDNSDAVIGLGYQKNFHNRLSGYDNESLYIPIAPTLPEESAIPMIADEDVIDHIPKNLPRCDRSHSCAHGVLLSLKLVQSGAHHTCSGGHDIVYTTPLLLESKTKILNIYREKKIANKNVFLCHN